MTGADGGIGRATALLFAREGAKVVLLRPPGGGPRLGGPDRRCAVSGTELERTGAAVRAAGGRALVVAGDPDDDECALDGVRRAIEAWGAIDVLVLDSTDRRASGAASLVRAATPYIGKGATFASVLRGTGYAGMANGAVHVAHSSLRAARPGFAHSMRSELERAGIFADTAARRGAPRNAPRAVTGPVNDHGHHVLVLHDGRACTVAACLLHLARADADWARDRG